MARTKISEFSATPANNTDIDSINIAEGCAPSGINDAIRELMSQLKDFQTGAVGDSFNGPVGTTTAAAGAFTTLSASSTVSGTGFSTYLASPPSIGSTAAGTGAFTTLAASGAVTLSGGTANGVTYLNGSKVLTSGSALTFDGTNLSTFGSIISSTAPAGGSLKRDVTSSYLSVTGGTAPNSNGATILLSGSTYAAANTAFVDATESVFRNLSGASEYMRLTSTGLGIGTSSPDAKLVIANPATGVPTLKLSGFADGTAGIPYAIINFYNEDGSQAGPNNAAAIKALNASSDGSGGQLAFYTALSNASEGSDALERMRLDSSGNLGLGVTPSAWSGYKAFQVGVGSADGAFIAAGNDTNVTTNAYFNAGWKYQTSANFAAMYKQTSGTHQWHTAPSGTAGAAITFTQAMTLDASGNLGVGATSVGAMLHLRRDTASSGATVYPNIRIDNPNAAGYTGLYFYADTTLKAGFEVSNAAGALQMIVANAERARIDSSGNLIQTVNTTAATLTTNQTLTFSIVNNSLLRISVRGSDGTTRTATLALA